MTTTKLMLFVAAAKQYMGAIQALRPTISLGRATIERAEVVCDLGVMFDQHPPSV